MKEVSIVCFIIFLVVISIFIVLFSKHNSETMENEVSNEIEFIEETETEISENEDNELDIITEENNTEQNVENNEIIDINKKDIYYLKVNNLANTVTVYSKDESGEFSIPIKAMVCSVGDFTPPCSKYPKAIYNTNGDKFIWGAMQGNVYAQYATRVTGNILFHSVPYTKRSNSSLEYWEYDKLGTKASLGCIRLSVEDAKWIYDYVEKGSIIEFYSDENPGPLGKPEPKKISDYPDNLRKWDPTDPNEKNPWIEYIEIEDKN